MTELPGLVARMLIRTDPMKIYFEEDDNKDEYDSEAAEIASGLQSCGSAADCLNLVYEVFSRNSTLSLARLNATSRPLMSYGAFEVRSRPDWTAGNDLR